MSDGTYIGALRDALRIFRTAATKLGRLDQEIEVAYDAHDVERALYLERVSASHAEDRRRLAYSLLLTAMRLQQAGAEVPNPRWKPPPWLWQEWEAMCQR